MVDNFWKLITNSLLDDCEVQFDKFTELLELSGFTFSSSHRTVGVMMILILILIVVISTSLLILLLLGIDISMLAKFRTVDELLNLRVSNIDVGAFGSHNGLDVLNHGSAVFCDQVTNRVLDLRLESRILCEGACAHIAETTELIVDDVDELEHWFLECGNDHRGEGAESFFGSDEGALDTGGVKGLLAEKFVRQARSSLEGHDVLGEAALDHVIEEGTTVKGFVFGARRGTATFNGVADEVGVVVEEGEEDGRGFLIGGVVHAEGFHALVGVEDHVVDLSFEIGKSLLDVVEEDTGHGLGEEFSAALVRDARVGGMILEELAFVGTSFRHGFILIDGLLGAVDDTNPTTTEGNLTTFENLESVSTFVHNIDLGKDTDGAVQLGIDRASGANSSRVGKIGVGGGDGEDDGVFGADELENHIVDLAFDILRLVADRSHNQTGKIDTSKGENVGRSDSQENRLRGNTILAGDFSGAALDFGTNFVEVGPLLILGVIELTIVLGAGGGRVEAEHEGAAGDDAGATGEEVTTDKGFEDGALAGGLGTDDSDLGEVDSGTHGDVLEGVLDFVDDANKFIVDHFIWFWIFRISNKN